MKEFWTVEDEYYQFDTREEAIDHCVEEALEAAGDVDEELPVFEITHHVETDQPLVATETCAELVEAILDLLTNGGPLSGQILPEIFREDRLDDLSSEVQLFADKLLQGSNAWKQEVEIYDPMEDCK